MYVCRILSVCVCVCVCQVEYQCDGFLEKNRDTVNEEQINVLKASKVGHTHTRLRQPVIVSSTQSSSDVI